MFGGSFGELGLIFVVALVVLGPKRMPGLVRKIGHWVGKARNMARDFQQQLENEINLDELNRMTETRAEPAQTTTSAPPAEFSGDPPAQPAADTGSNLASSGYPYGIQEPAPATAPQPVDDTYSHAHAAGEAPADKEDNAAT